jgi:AraC-like DNA-binding protein
MINGQFFFNLNPVNFFIISGLVQNFILAVILFFRQRDQPLANKLLSFTVVVVNLQLTYLMILDTNLDNLFPGLLWIPYSFLTAIGPLIYYYTRALTGARFHLPEIYKHFIPAMIELGLQLIIIAYSIRHDQLYYNTPFYFYVAPMIYAAAAVSIFHYLRMSLKIIRNHENWVLKNYSNLKEITLKWLQKLIEYYRLLWIVWVPFVAIFLLFFRFQLQYFAVVLALYLLMLILTYLTFWIGLEGLGRTNLIVLKPEDRKSENKNFGNLPDQVIQNIIKKMTDAMTIEKIYLNENLSLRDFALHLKADPNLLSYILNSQLNRNFHDFVNQYRVEEAKNKLNDPRYANLSLLGIGLESGFNSKTTFNRVFKQATGMTPTEYQKKLLGNQAHPSF